MYTIYKYTNTVNGRVYIGQTRKTLEERAQTNGRNYRECRRFYAAIKKCSWSAFTADILEVVETVEEANAREIFYIDLYNSTDDHFGYNIAPGGDCKEMSAESKKIISEKAKKRYSDKTANPMYGKKHSQSAINKQRVKKLGSNNPMYGTKWTDVQRANSGTRGKHLNLSDEQRKIMSDRMKVLGKTIGIKPVRCIEDDKIYESLTAAAKEYGVSGSTLCGHLRGAQHSCCGKHFEYVNLEDATTIETIAV